MCYKDYQYMLYIALFNYCLGSTRRYHWFTCLDLPRLAQTCLAKLQIACISKFLLVFAYLPRLA